MHTALTAVGVVLAGTALGGVAYTAVSPADHQQTTSVQEPQAGGRPAAECTGKARFVKGVCVTVVHVGRDNAGSGSGPQVTPPAAPQVITDVPAVPPLVHDQFDDHGGDSDDHFDDDDDDWREDLADDRADEAEDRLDDRLDAVEDAFDDRLDAADDVLDDRFDDDDHDDDHGDD